MKTHAILPEQESPAKTTDKASVTNLSHYRAKQILNSLVTIKNRDADSLPTKVLVKELLSPLNNAAFCIRRRDGSREFYVDNEKYLKKRAMSREDLLQLYLRTRSTVAIRRRDGSYDVYIEKSPSREKPARPSN
jgi:hypothetical protein